MTLSDFVERLLEAARAGGWPAERVPSFIAQSFSGEHDPVSPLQEGEAVGLQLGPYPVLASTVQLRGLDQLEVRLRALHGQMVIARSYMVPEIVINAHILLCATESGTGDWAQVMDIAQRDEAVCRKVIWVPDAADLTGSFAAFQDRTFLARPWEGDDKITTAPLDHNGSVVSRALMGAGLSRETADLWEEAALEHRDDPDFLVARLVDLTEAAS